MLMHGEPGGLIECSAGAIVWLMALITIEATRMSPSSRGKLIV